MLGLAVFQGRLHQIVVPNCDDNEINGLRDLEDFARLHIRVDAATAFLPDVTYSMSYKPTDHGAAPVINLFQAVNKSTAYLSDKTTAQKQVSADAGYNHLLITIGSNEVELPQEYILKNGQVSPFLFEGKKAGTGVLNIVARVNGAEVGHAEVTLALRPIKQFCQKYYVTLDSSTGLVQNTVQTDPTYGDSQYSASSKECVLYVHGWAMEDWEKDRWLETTFKRLWWEGYRGHVAAYQWPTLNGTFTYDNSENIAWQSSDGLVSLLESLNQTYPDGVRILGHSMGNIVVGEALRKLSKSPSSTPFVHTYAAAQAAVSAQMYDNSLAETSSGITTPNLGGHFFVGVPTTSSAIDTNLIKNEGQPYFANNSVMGKPKMVRYYNELDFALNAYSFNNYSKPDNYLDVYSYHEGDLNVDTYNPLAGDHFFIPSIEKQLDFPGNTYQIFAYCVQSRTKALGAITVHVDQFQDEINLRDFGYDDRHYSHSKEFRSDFPSERQFWDSLCTEFDLKLIEK